jgi:tetratricopeptide (TPR) repeat protein
MIDPNKKEPLPVNSNDVCYRAFELIAAKQYADAEKLLSINMARTEDKTAIALYHSVLGVLFKIQGEYKTAWRHYERAEKLLPDDPALKIISARLLIEQFAEYAQAIKKAKKAMELAAGNPVFAHQGYTTMGLAYCKKGDRKKTIEMLTLSQVNDFLDFITAKNIDFELVEALLRRGWGEENCRAFIVKALEFAKKTKEEQFIRLFGKMLAAFERDYPTKVTPVEELQKGKFV